MDNNCTFDRRFTAGGKCSINGFPKNSGGEYECPWCGKQYATRSCRAFRRHVDAQCRDKKQEYFRKGYDCSQCEKRCTSRARRWEHRTVHSETTRPYPVASECGCPRVFSNRHDAAIHARYIHERVFCTYPGYLNSLLG